MKLLLDENLSPRLCDHLRDIWTDVVHVRAVGLATADDSAVWAYARQSQPGCRRVVAACRSTRSRRSVTSSEPLAIVRNRASEHLDRADDRTSPLFDMPLITRKRLLSRDAEVKRYPFGYLLNVVRVFLSAGMNEQLSSVVPRSMAILDILRSHDDGPSVRCVPQQPARGRRSIAPATDGPFGEP